MKKVLFILFFISAGSLFAQDSTTVYEPYSDTLVFRRSFFQMYGTSDAVYRPVYTDHGILDGNQKFSDRELKSYTLGIGWIRQVRKNLFMDAGVELSQTSVQTPGVNIPLSGNGQVQEIYASYIHYATHCNVPVMVSYTVGKKIYGGISCGVGFNYKIIDNVQFFKSYSNGSSYGDGTSFKRKEDVFNIDGRVAMFIGYRFKQCEFRIMPVYRMELLSTYRKLSDKRSTSCGIGISLII
jgi:hypothetical protein